MFGTERIPELEQKIEQLRQQGKVLAARAQSLIRYGRQQTAGVDSFYQAKLNESARQANVLNAAAPAHLMGDWQADRWQAWTPVIGDFEKSDGAGGVPRLIRVGDLIEPAKANQAPFVVPALAPFIGQNRTLIIATEAGKYNAGLGLLQSLLIRSALMLPHQTFYTLLDPAGNGAAFPMRRHLPRVRENSGDLRRDLDLVIQDIQRVNETYLDASTPSFELVDPKRRIDERFQFVVAADFPNKYDRRAIEALQSIANTGPRTGTYVIIHYNKEHELPRDMSMDEFKNAAFIRPATTVNLGAYEVNFQPDGAPAPQVQTIILERLRAARPPERKVDWRMIIPAQLWSESATDLVSTPIGVSGANDTLALWFGANNKGQPCAHGMLGAMTGSGKSNLYHILILGLCLRYSPLELRLFLIDGKDGVEFSPYRHLPHAEVVSLKSSPQLSRSVLKELVAERERRNLLFTRAGVVDLKAYRAAGQPYGNLPRILLLVDEYQELFEGDKDGHASNLLLQLAQQGRSAGIHMLLGSQRFGAAGMLHQKAIFGNFHLRMAMQMTNEDILALTEFGRQGKQRILACDIPGKIVVNDRTGDDSGNQSGKVAYLRAEDRDEILRQLGERAKTLPNADVSTIVFDGKAQPNLIENPYVTQLRRERTWLSPERMEGMARRPVHQEGFEMLDWFAAERPHALWLGQVFSVRGQAMAVVRRRAAENMLIIGGANAVRYGMLAASIASLALNSGPNQMAVLVVDRSIPGTAWSNTLATAAGCILKPAGYPAAVYRDNQQLPGLLDQLTKELDKRRALNEAMLGQQRSLFVVMTELDRVDELRRRPDSYGLNDSPMGQQLNRICVEGPPLGIHLILSFSGIRPMSYIIDERRGLLNFRHRVALQMSEDESLTFVRSRKAAQLQSEGPSPVAALYLDVENDQTLRFKPYSIESTIDFNKQLEQIGQTISTWSKPK